MAKKVISDTQKIEIGKRIELIRNAKSLLKEDLAKQINTTGQHMGSVINGDVGLSVEKIIALSETTGFSTDYILKGKQEEFNEKIKNLIYEAIEYNEKSRLILQQLSLYIN